MPPPTLYHATKALVSRARQNRIRIIMIRDAECCVWAILGGRKREKNFSRAQKLLSNFWQSRKKWNRLTAFQIKPNVTFIHHVENPSAVALLRDFLRTVPRSRFVINYIEFIIFTAERFSMNKFHLLRIIIFLMSMLEGTFRLFFLQDRKPKVLVGVFSVM